MENWFSKTDEIEVDNLELQGCKCLNPIGNWIGIGVGLTEIGSQKVKE